MLELKNILTPDDEENIKNCGAVGFTWQQLCNVFCFDREVVKSQFSERRGKVYELYNEGRLQHELLIRLAVLNSAKNGSTPAQQQMQSYYAAADASIDELNYE